MANDKLDEYAISMGEDNSIVVRHKCGDRIAELEKREQELLSRIREHVYWQSGSDNYYWIDTKLGVGHLIYRMLRARAGEVAHEECSDPAPAPSTSDWFKCPKCNGTMYRGTPCVNCGT